MRNVLVFIYIYVYVPNLCTYNLLYYFFFSKHTLGLYVPMWIVLTTEYFFFFIKYKPCLLYSLHTLYFYILNHNKSLFLCLSTRLLPRISFFYISSKHSRRIVFLKIILKFHKILFVEKLNIHEISIFPKSGFTCQMLFFFLLSSIFLLFGTFPFFCSWRICIYTDILKSEPWIFFLANVTFFTVISWPILCVCVCAVFILYIYAM